MAGRYEDEFSADRLSRQAQTTFVEDRLQPRGNDYNGIGLQRPSVYIQLDDDMFQGTFLEACSFDSSSKLVSP